MGVQKYWTAVSPHPLALNYIACQKSLAVRQHVAALEINPEWHGHSTAKRKGPVRPMLYWERSYNIISQLVVFFKQHLIDITFKDNGAAHISKPEVIPVMLKAFKLHR